MLSASFCDATALSSKEFVTNQSNYSRPGRSWSFRQGIKTSSNVVLSVCKKLPRSCVACLDKNAPDMAGWNTVPVSTDRLGHYWQESHVACNPPAATPWPERSNSLGAKTWAPPVQLLPQVWQGLMPRLRRLPANPLCTPYKAKE